MNEDFAEDDAVWYQDIGYVVLEIQGAMAHIEELDWSVMGRNYSPGITDIWVPLIDVEAWTEEDYKDFED